MEAEIEGGKRSEEGGVDEACLRGSFDGRWCTLKRCVEECETRIVSRARWRSAFNGI